MSILLISRHRIPLSRDIVFLATADEERGGTEGIEQVFEKIPEIADASCALNEGGGIRLTGSQRTPTYCIGVAEKVSLRIKITAEGKGGHGSVYTPDNPNLILLRALRRLDEMEEKPFLIDVVARFFNKIAPLMPEKLKHKYANLSQALKDSEFDRLFRADGYYDAMIRHTKVITMLQSGSKINVVPSKASAFVDCRLVPGASKQAYLEKIRVLLGDEGISVEVMESGRESPVSSPEGPLFKAIENVAVKHEPEAIVTPFMMTGGSDSSYLRSRGIPTYGFVPFRLTTDEKQRVHGKNERLSLENIRYGVKTLLNIILECDCITR